VALKVGDLQARLIKDKPSNSNHRISKTSRHTHPVYKARRCTVYATVYRMLISPRPKAKEAADHVQFIDAQGVGYAENRGIVPEVNAHLYPITSHESPFMHHRKKGSPAGRW
jgi:hypothetical protein